MALPIAVSIGDTVFGVDFTATTKAIASVREWVKETLKWVRPSSAALAAARPWRIKTGLPRLLGRISISRQRIPLIPVPRAFEVASFAANRAANSLTRFR